MGVALSLAFELLIQYPELQIRFFSQDAALFEGLIGRDHPLTIDWYGEVKILDRLSYIPLEEYTEKKDSECYNFFGYTIPQDGIMGVNRIVNFDYLQFRSNESLGFTDRPNLHLTSYFAGSTRIVHFVPGFVAGCGGITLPLEIPISREIVFQYFGLPQNISLCFVFVYESSLREIF